MATPATEKKVEFPYRSLDEAAADGFAKIGGVQRAFFYLEKGYKEVHWRRRTEHARIIRQSQAETELKELREKLAKEKK